MFPSSEVKKIEISDYLKIMSRRIWLVLLCFAVSAVFFVFIALRPTPKRYEAKAFFIVGSHPAAGAIEMQSIFGKSGRPISGDVQTMIAGSLQSVKFAESVAKAINMSPRKLLSMIRIGPVGDKKAGLLGNVIQISAKGKDPVLVAKVVNAWLEEIIRRDIETKKGYSEFGATWLEDSREEIASKLKAAETRLQNFEEVNQGVRQKSLALAGMRQKKSELQEQLNEMLLKYKDKHPAVTSVKRRIGIIDEQIDELKIATVGGEDVYFQYEVLSQQVKLYESMYRQFLDASEKADIAKGLILPSIQVVSTAQVPTRPIYVPKLIPFNILLIGIVVGLGLCFLLEFIDTSPKTAEEVEFYAQMPFLGEVPYVKGRGVNAKALNRVVNDEPDTALAEAIRNVKVSVLFAFPDDANLKAMLVASTAHDEGKTFVAANLASAFAMAGEKTVLIDGDIRKGVLKESFSDADGKGLSEYFSDGVSVEEIVTGTDIKNLSVIGTGAHAPNAVDLISPDKVAELIEELSKTFDRIVIDGVPLDNYADDLFYANSCDAIINVIAKGETSLHDILSGKKKIEEIDTHLGKTPAKKVHTFAAVLNNTTPFKADQKYLKMLQSLLKLR